MVQQAYFVYETRPNQIAISKIKKICEVLNVSSDYLLGLSDDPQKYPLNIDLRDNDNLNKYTFAWKDDIIPLHIMRLIFVFADEMLYAQLKKYEKQINKKKDLKK